MQSLPNYDQLPVVEGVPHRSAWGVWGGDDRLGCLNKIDAAAVRRGLESARHGEVFSLNHGYGDDRLTRWQGREPFEHEARPVGGVALDDVLHGLNTQASTQWDGFRHIGGIHGLYNGLGHDEHGVAFWAARGIVTRGVLVDLARWREAQGRPIDVGGGEAVPLDEFFACVDAQGVTIEPGDVLFLRFGFWPWWDEARGGGDDPLPPLRSPGLEANERTAAALWDLHIAAIAGDFGVDPIDLSVPFTLPPGDLGDPAVAFGLGLHMMLPWFGMPIGELFVLDPLAEACAAGGDYTFLLTSAPMNLHNGIATPANALAVR